MKTSRVAVLWLLVLAGCGDSTSLVDARYGSAWLGVPYAEPTELSWQQGELPLGETPTDRGLLRVPQSYQPGQPAALVVLLHGAGGDAEGILDLVRTHADATGTLVLAPKSEGRTWDMLVHDRYGPDLAFLDLSLTRVFREYSVDPERITISGFSDGASYALSVGLTNGHLFRRIAAFSPGGVAASELEGKPGVFISHGTLDPVIPIDVGGRFITGQLREEDYMVDFREFEGSHTVPAEIAREGFTFLVGAAAP
ncbi:alpha/beta hydrolase [Pyxidicoccus xibeiensis]|uniref:alpha/beta hydrolase n=1 Tax=Pyxidicoccus xibeiensis TaxID=2906759 RepID=UPI0020A72041|nr:phospholipase [Pyxidicoccus xibeiensis]MCP3141922.1 phospholipase [Pyxidicoccus xibeiensis]